MNPCPSYYLSVCLSSGQFVCVNLYAFLSFYYSIKRVGVWHEKNAFRSILAAQEAGPVCIKVHTKAGWKLGITYFLYVDENYEALKRTVKDPAQLSLFLNKWFQEHRIIGSNSNVAQTPGLFSLPDQGKWIQKQSL